jgi:hypothetical protein
MLRHQATSTLLLLVTLFEVKVGCAAQVMLALPQLVWACECPFCECPLLALPRGRGEQSTRSLSLLKAQIAKEHRENVDLQTALVANKELIRAKAVNAALVVRIVPFPPACYDDGKTIRDSSS